MGEHKSRFLCSEGCGFLTRLSLNLNLYCTATKQILDLHNTQTQIYTYKLLLPSCTLNTTIKALHSCINTLTVLKTLKIFMYFPDQLLYHRLKHKHNITKHNTLRFYVVHYQEGSYIHGNFVYMIFSKGEIQSSTAHHSQSLSLSLSEPLRTKQLELSLLSLKMTNTFTHMICKEHWAYAKISFPLPSTLYL